MLPPGPPGPGGPPVTPDREPLSVRAYARQRGVSHQAVLRAIARGRLQTSLIVVAGVTKIADRARADQEWAANTDLSKAPDHIKARAAALEGDQDPEATTAEGDAPAAAAEGDEPASLANSSAIEKHWKAKLAELHYKQRAGELVHAADMTAAIAEAFSTLRTKLLGLPSKAKQQLPHLTLSDLATLDSIVRETLEALAAADLA